MSKCNLLRPLGWSDGSYEGGTFYLFSQYADDLTRQNAHGDAYRVVPSKFAAFNIDYTGKENKDIGELFQNKFEHSCSVFRHKMANDNETDPELFTPEHSANLFWQTMKGLGFNCPTSGDCPENLVWIGESEVCGTTVIDGDAFSEIYCYIPGSAHARVYEASSIDVQTAVDPDTMNYIYGWTSSTYPTNTGLAGDAPQPLRLETTGCPQHLKPEWHEYPGDLLQSHGDLIDSTIQNTGWSNSSSQDNYFNINTVAVFYDIVAKDEEGNYHSIYENIPLGIYFTGPIEGSTLKNEVKKYISHDDIYGQGTAYGLRITTKFSAHPCLNTSCEDHAHAEVVYAGHSYAEAAAVIDSMRAAGDAVLAAVSQNSAFNTELMNHLSQFRNKNTNIPYIRTVGGDDYWFVNGRNTGRKVNGVSATVQEIIDQVMPEITEYIDDAMPDLDPDGTGKAYIEYIYSDKYTGDAEVTEIPELEDFQDLNGLGEKRSTAGMFQGCSSLVCIPRLEISNSKNMSNMFRGCSSIESIDLSDSWQCTTFANAFSGCSSLVSVKIDAMSAADFNGAFTGCGNLKNVLIDNIKPGTLASPRVIDLKGTQVNLWSLKRMIRNVQDQKINTSTGAPNGYVTIRIPNSMSFDLSNEIDLALNNKGVKFTIE